jgi:hypothetical protein
MTTRNVKFCDLCGSGVLGWTDTPDGGIVLETLTGRADVCESCAKVLLEADRLGIASLSGGARQHMLVMLQEKS